MTKSARVTAVSMALGLLLVGALLWVGQKPLSPDQLEQLRQGTQQAELALQVARMTCEAMPEPEDRASCHLGLAGAELPVRVARGILATAEACAPGPLGETCRAVQLQQAQTLLPELRRVAEQLQPPPASSSAPVPEASAPLRLPQPGEGGQ